ncbi:hypothetical protein [Nonomuraea sp. NPDC050310]|uniref:hypothetical protein n=1 Tax=Nonomuraea sp. NPDC050310 TaxID=3154935 RepID=UPI0033ED9691
MPSPAVYGYIRAAGISAPRRDALSATIAAFCELHELRLAGVFAERDREQSAAFAGLLDVLGLPATYGVVVPTLSHLAPHAALTSLRVRQVEALGARLLTIRPTPVSRCTPRHTASGGSS